MKALLIPAVALATCLSVDDAFAQDKKEAEAIPKQETVIIKKESGSPQTTIEIKDGNVYLNGEKVASTGDKDLNKKIIIDGDNDFAGPALFEQFDDLPGRKAMLGVFTNPDNDKKTGAIVDGVTPNSAAARAGLKKGDIITKIDGKTVSDAKELVDLIAHHEVGDKVNISFQRDGKFNNTEAMLTQPTHQNPSRIFDFKDLPDMDIPNTMRRPFMFDARDAFLSPGPKLGITAEERLDAEGVLVTDVKPQSPAEKAGLKKDDVIVKIADDEISSVDDLQETLRRMPINEKVKLQYQRNGKTYATDITFPKEPKKKDL